MLPLGSLLNGLLLVLACAPGAAGLASVGELLVALPKCSSAGTITTIQQAGCSLTNVTALVDCVCKSTPIKARLSELTQLQCPFQQQLEAVTVLQDICKGYPQESRASLIKNSAIATMAVSIPIVLIRFAARYFKGYTIGADDWTCLAALITLVALAAIEFVSADIGLGLHYWDVGLATQTRLLILFFASQLIYILIQILVKLSLLLLYNRVFPTAWFRLTTKIIAAFIILHGLAFLFTITFQCNPVAAAWNKHIDGQCIDTSAVIMVGAIFSIVEDFVLILLPVTEIRKLNMSKRVKFTLAFVFAIGSFSTVTSLVRLKVIIQYRSTSDPSFDNVELVVWSLLELMTAVVTASLPSLKPFIMAIPRFTKSLRSRTKASEYSMGNVSGSAGREQKGQPVEIATIGSPQKKGLGHASGLGNMDGWSSEENMISPVR